MIMDDSFFPDWLRETAEEEYNFAINNAPAGNISHILDKVGSSDEYSGEASSVDSDDEAGQANFSLRTEDTAEIQLVNEFMFTGCGCSLGFGASACSKLWSRKVILTTRMSCFEMSREVLYTAANCPKKLTIASVFTRGIVLAGRRLLLP